MMHISSILGVTGISKLDVFLENSLTAFDPPEGVQNTNVQNTNVQNTNESKYQQTLSKYQQTLSKYQQKQSQYQQTQS